MIEALLLGVLMLAVLVMVPLLIVKALFHVAVFLLLLPFKLLGAVFQIVVGGVGILAKLFLWTGTLVAGAVALVIAIVAVPLIPVLLVAGVLWLVLRPQPSRATPMTWPVTAR